MAIRYDTWLARLREVSDGLASHGIDIQLAVGDPVPEDELEREEAYFAQTMGTFGFKFHESLRALYAVARSIKFQWQTRAMQDIPPVFGGMHLMPVSMLYETDPGTDTKELWHGVWRILDKSGAVTQVLVRFNEDGDASLAWRSTEGGSESITPLDLTIDDYFELSLAACALHGWPLLFASDQKILTEEHIEDIYAALDDLTPPADPSAIRHRRGGH
jgi:hypothetical protein